ncbi:MAG: RNA methyltransferase [Candidatus Woesearchaeota archaeon]
MISVVLVEPENAGNVGAVARAMANFDFSELILINPKCKHKSSTAMKRAKSAARILEKARVAKTFRVLKKFDYLVATTARIGRDYNIPRSPVSPKELAGLLGRKGDSKVAILFGREGKGLSNEEISLCDFVVAIPSSKKHGTLNISHAAGIVLYELFAGMKMQSISSHIAMAGSAEKEQLLKMFRKVLDSLHFATPGKKHTQVVVWKRLIGKSFLTKREAYALMGLLKKCIYLASSKSPALNSIALRPRRGRPRATGRHELKKRFRPKDAKQIQKN